jgi:shikimate dehydrogenase
MSTPIRLCLVGRGVTASPSQAMHEAALHACGIHGSYLNREVAPEELPEFVVRLRSGAYRGCNVTIPYKATLAAACDQLEGDALILGVVNTIRLEPGGRLIGSNTDPRGFELALIAQTMWPQEGGRAVVLGAGGAAAAVTLALTRVPMSEILVAARRDDAAADVARRLRDSGNVEATGWDLDRLLAAVAEADILVNATPVGVEELPVDVRDLPPSCTVADVRYRPQPVDFVAAALDTGRRACDGLEMLLQQGALSFETWTGTPAPIVAMRRALRRALGR